MVQGVQRGQWVTQQEDGCKKESTLMDECLDDCLVGACGCQSIHRGEFWPHQRWPETDGKILAGH